ncbi:MAG: hypothetical protein A2W19_03500 [Spirochaetes bacterium RBG_16_49_21]|nr:MAG: hypothetical protein A2W19_03500 [Spirochaetes bacterium RBG_16_49_21]
MKKIFCISVVSFFVLITACAVDYRKAIIGTWDAGKASRESRIVVSIDGNGSLTAALTNTDMRPIKGAYEIDKNRLVIKLSNMTLSYEIVKVVGNKLVMSSDERRITWTRIK